MQDKMNLASWSCKHVSLDMILKTMVESDLMPRDQLDVPAIKSEMKQTELDQIKDFL